jgi:hypothetical protein
MTSSTWMVSSRHRHNISGADIMDPQDQAEHHDEAKKVHVITQVPKADTHKNTKRSYKPTWLFWYVCAAWIAPTATIGAIIMPLSYINSVFKLIYWVVIILVLLIYYFVVAHYYGPSTQPTTEQLNIPISQKSDELGTGISTEQLHRIVAKLDPSTKIEIITRRAYINFYGYVVNVVLLSLIIVSGAIWIRASIQLEPYVLLFFIITIIALAGVMIVIRWVKWNVWCLLITSSHMTISQLYPPELIWMRNRSPSIPIRKIDSTDSEVTLIGKMCNSGEIRFDTAGKADDKDFNHIRHIANAELVEGHVKAMSASHHG